MQVFNGVFNWTQTYRRDSDIFNPYGEFRSTTSKEAESVTKQLVSESYFRKKNNSALIINSNCNDNARRFRIVDILSKYINVDQYGECGRGCPRNRDSCDKLHPSYKFYLAFENSFCRDYITEKYWRRYTYRQIPVVAWRQDYSGLVIPKSYINVFDFPDIDAAGRYIADVDKNETLFNSYFEWMKQYKITDKCDLCRTCESLHTKRIPPQVYTNFEGWLTDDTCHKATVMSVLHETADRFVFDGTFSNTLWVIRFCP
ncbi:hypothetical protein CHS0354_027466 [Potamilus streckersoni]|uniref:Fucosyltransferase n=1 Tax=Potamilus streckersoni TaxID=2493646 RepID=A0AAE0T7H7_9BIVA|nr:hypothetical protein CHS0354_027466 [Potamilus streckersoni]